VAVATGGTISPGEANGQITILGSLVLSNGSITALRLDAGGGYCDKLVVATNVTYGGTLQLTNIPGDLTNGSSFQLFSAKNYAGAFNNLLPASPGPDLKWNTNELKVDGVLRVFATPSPPPKIINPVLSGGALLFTATDGIPYDPCCVLSSTNIASPLSNWEFWTTNYFDASGGVTFTNPVSAGESGRYFLLYVQ
jgi:hypothetical protein